MPTTRQQKGRNIPHQSVDANLVITLVEPPQQGIAVDRPDPLELSRASQMVVMSVKLVGAPTGNGNGDGTGGVTLELETDPAADVAIAPANLTFTRDNWDTAQKATVKLTPAALNTRSERAFKVKVGVSDAAGTDNYGDVATLTIAANIDLVNRAPVFAALSARLLYAGEETAITLKAASDAEGDDITYAVVNKPGWLGGVPHTENIAGRSLRLTASAATPKGRHTITVTATDAQGDAAPERLLTLVATDSYRLLDWKVVNGRLAFTFNADFCDAFADNVFFFDTTIEQSSDGSKEVYFEAYSCANAAASISSAYANIYPANINARSELAGGGQIAKQLTISFSTPPATFDYSLVAYMEYHTEEGQTSGQLTRENSLDYAVGHVTVTIDEGAVATTDDLVTLTLGSAIGSSAAKPTWVAAATAEKAVAITPVVGSETSEAVVALSSADTATYASDNDVFARLTIITQERNKAATNQNAAETRLVIKVREVGDFQADTGTAPALAANGAVAVFSFTGTGCDTTATYELEIPGSGMAKQTGLYCKTAVTDSVNRSAQRAGL